MFIPAYKVLFLSFFVTSITIECSDTRGISECEHFPGSPYVCEPCIEKLNKESIDCSCSYGLRKNTANLNCPYHREKYLKWLDDNGMVEEYNRIVYPEQEKQNRQSYNPSSSTYSSSIPVSTSSTSTSTTYQPAPQSLRSSMPSLQPSSKQHSSSEERKRHKENARRVKRSKTEKKNKKIFSRKI